MKKLFKVVAFGFLGLVLLGAIASLFDNPNQSEKNEQTQPPIVESEKPTVARPKKEFNLAEATSLPALLEDLDSCFVTASTIGSLSGTDLEFAVKRGNAFYNKAFDEYQSLQKEAGEELPKSKAQVINNALNFYAEVFNNRFSPGSLLYEELMFVNSSLSEYPDAVSQVERDYLEGVFRVIVGPQGRRAVNFAGEAAWCLTQIQGGNRILLEGEFPKNGYGRFDVTADQLPIYLGSSKTFSIDNPDRGPGAMHLIFMKCEKN